MRKKANIGPILIILVCAIAAGLFVGWLAIRSPDDAKSGPVVKQPATQETETNKNTDTKGEVAEETNEPSVTEPAEEPEPEVAKTWDDQVHDILVDDKMDEDVKADKFADMILSGKLPEAAQVEVAEHLVNLVPDEQFKLKAAKIVASETIPGPVSSVIFNDLMNRSDDLRLPLTLQIAKNKNHPLHAEALESLELTLTEDFGEDWEKWEQAIKESLEAQGLTAEEEATATPTP